MEVTATSTLALFNGSMLCMQILILGYFRSCIGGNKSGGTCSIRVWKVTWRAGAGSLCGGFALLARLARLAPVPPEAPIREWRHAGYPSCMLEGCRGSSLLPAPPFPTPVSPSFSPPF